MTVERNVLTIMPAFALIGSWNLTVVVPSGSCYRNERAEETGSNQPKWLEQTRLHRIRQRL